MKIKNIIIALFAVSLICSGCTKWLTVQPIDRQTEAQLFATKGGFYTALNGVYNQLSKESLYGKTLTYGTMGILENRYTVPSINDINTNLLKWAYTDEKVANLFDNTWKEGYNVILNCNVIIKNCELQKDIILSESDYNIIKGEALAVRAFMHLDVFRLWGPVYKTGAEKISIPYNDATTAQTLPLLKASDFAARLVQDIEQAEMLLLKSDPILTDGVQNTPLTSEEIKNGTVQTYRYRQMRMNYFALLTLKARTYLYIGDKDKALAAAKQVIDHGQTATLFPFVDPSKLLGNYTTPDRVFSTECLFGYYNSNRGLIFKNIFSTETASIANLQQPRANYVANSLFKGETNDFRYMTQWEKSTFAGNANDMFTKYRDITPPATDTVRRFYSLFMPIIRLSEVYYIAAECEPNFELAKTYFNTIRFNRGITAPTTAANQAALETLINNEYNREFAGEGQLLYLYKRKFINIPGAESGVSSSSVSITDARVVLPLPASESEIR